MPRLGNPSNAPRPATRSQAVVVPSSMHSDPSLSLMVVPSSVQSEATLPELFDYETPTAIARQPRPASPPLSPVLELAVISGSRESTPGVADSHTVHSPRGSGSWAPTLPLSLSPTMGSQTSPEQETSPRQEAPVQKEPPLQGKTTPQREVAPQREVTPQQESSTQQEIPLEQETLNDTAAPTAKQKKPYSRKTEPVETVATRIGARRRTAATATPRGASSSSAAPTGARAVTRRQKSVIDLDENLEVTAPTAEPAPSAEPAPRLSGVRVYVIPLNMDKVIFNLSLLHVLQLNGQWLGPQEKILVTDPRVAPTIPPLDQEETTHIVTELTSIQAVKTYLGVDAINVSRVSLIMKSTIQSIGTSLKMARGSVLIKEAPYMLLSIAEN